MGRELAREYRALAANLFNGSKRQTDDVRKGLMLDMAAAYIRMAEHIEKSLRRNP
jgi:hypothetical protein